MVLEVYLLSKKYALFLSVCIKNGYSHAKITSNRNKNAIMYNNQDDLILKDFSKNEVCLKIIKMRYMISKDNVRT